jgi:hypothetical protein
VGLGKQVFGTTGMMRPRITFFFFLLFGKEERKKERKKEGKKERKKDVKTY